MEMTMLSMIIIFWFGTAIIHTFNQSETRYSKLIVWLAFISVSALSIGQLI